MLKSFCFLLLLAASAPCWAQQEAEASSADSSAESSSDSPADESYTNPESLEHRAGYNRRAEFGSAANTVNQLEEDDRVKEPIIRFPGIDEGLQGWYDMKRRLNENSGVKFGALTITRYTSLPTRH